MDALGLKLALFDLKEERVNFWIGERKVPLRKSSVVNPVGLPVLIVLFFFPFLGLNFIAASEVEDVIQMVNGQYSKIKSIQGMIRREIRDGQDTQSVTGRFLIKKPDRYYVEFSDPHQIVCSNDSLCWVEKVEENVVLKFHIAKMNRFEKEALGIGGLLGLNVFEQLRDGFRFSLRSASISTYLNLDQRGQMSNLSFINKAF